MSRMFALHYYNRVIFFPTYAQAIELRCASLGDYVTEVVY